MGISKSRSNVVNLFYKFYFFGLTFFFFHLFLLILLYRFSLSFSSTSANFPFYIYLLKLYQAEQEIEDLCENISIAKVEGIINLQMGEDIFMLPIAMFLGMYVFCLLFLGCIAVESLQ